jgi:hypothetical protein
MTSIFGRISGALLDQGRTNVRDIGAAAHFANLLAGTIATGAPNSSQAPTFSHMMAQPFSDFAHNPGLATGMTAAAMLPVPWGMKGRTGPAVSRAERFRQRDSRDSVRRLSSQMQKLPVLSDDQAAIHNFRANMGLNEAGMSRKAAWKEARARRGWRVAHTDQYDAALAGLNSLKLDPATLEMMGPKAKLAVATMIKDARRSVVETMVKQRDNPSPILTEFGPLTAPQRIEGARATIGSIMERESRIMGSAAQIGKGRTSDRIRQHQARLDEEQNNLYRREPGFRLGQQFGYR